MRTHNTPNAKPSKASQPNTSTTTPVAKPTHSTRQIEVWFWSNPRLAVALTVSIVALIIGGAA